MALNTHQWMSIGFLSGLALLWKIDKPEPEECKNVKALVAYTCAECGEDRGLFEVKDGNFYRFNPDLRDCGCDGFEVNSNEFIICEECDDTFWHRYAGWSEHLRIIMNRDEDESFEAQSQDDLIDTLIEIRQELAKEEGLEDWKNESAGPLDSLSSAFIQELIWYMDGDRDTWDAESFGAEDEPKVFKVKGGFWYCNECGEEWDNKEDAENCYEEDFGWLVGEGDETPYQRYKKAVGLDAESFDGEWKEGVLGDFEGHEEGKLGADKVATYTLDNGKIVEVYECYTIMNKEGMMTGKRIDFYDLFDKEGCLNEGEPWWPEEGVPSREVVNDVFGAESFDAEEYICPHCATDFEEEGLELWEKFTCPSCEGLIWESYMSRGHDLYMAEEALDYEGDAKYGAESFEAEDSRRQLKKLMKGMSKAKKKRISKMVQLRGIENTLSEVLANSEVFAAPASFGEPEDNDTYHNLDETEWRSRDSCEICARPFSLNKFGRNLIQHYLKESNHGIKGWKTKENPEGTRRTARNITGFFLHEYRLDALNQYVLFQEKTKISDKVIELLRLSIVERIIAGDVVNLIQMMDMQDEIDDAPIFGESFEKDFEAESFNKL